MGVYNVEPGTFGGNDILWKEGSVEIDVAIAITIANKYTMDSKLTLTYASLETNIGKSTIVNVEPCFKDVQPIDTEFRFLCKFAIEIADVKHAELDDSKWLEGALLSLADSSSDNAKMFYVASWNMELERYTWRQITCL